MSKPEAHLETYYDKVKRAIETYIRLKKERELYASGKIVELVENYYNMLKALGEIR